MYFVYNLITTVFFILISPFIFIIFAFKPKLRAGFWQKIGFYPQLQKKNKVIWVHAVSVGEVNAVEGFVKKIRETHSDFQIYLTTVTRTGNNVAQQKLGKIVDEILYFPYDFIFSIKSAIKAIKPDYVYIAETEIWPNFSNELNKQNIPVVIINGRISPNSYKGYKKFKFFFQKILKNYTCILMQTNDDKKRIVEIGAPAEKTEVMGNLKFDISYVLNQDEISKLKESFLLEDKRLLIAGSTHKGEDEIILNTFKILKAEFKDLKLLLAPRHPERNNQVLKLIAETGLKFGLRSTKSTFKNVDIIMLDTMGELGKLYSTAYIAFIGGSYSGTGGHNPLEPAIYNVPSVSGPDIYNFKDVYRFMVQNNATIIVETPQKLYNILKELLKDKTKHQEISNSCKKIFDENKGSLDYLMNKFEELEGV